MPLAWVACICTPLTGIYSAFQETYAAFKVGVGQIPPRLYHNIPRKLAIMIFSSYRSYGRRNSEQHFICNCSLQAAAFISGNKMKGIFHAFFFFQ